MSSPFDPTHQHHDVDSKIVAALERLAQAFRVLLWEKNRDYNLSPIQIQFLVYLLYHAAKQCPVGQLAREFTLTPATVSDAITTLEEKKLVFRERCQDDRRLALVSLTADGRKTARRLSTWADVMQKNIARFETAEKVVVMKFLMRLIESLQQAGVITLARMCLTCKFFQPNAHPNTLAPHHCRLLDKPLADSELRLNCPEHEMMSVE
ncbi:MAG: MarR family transcriptional regulator [candidate division KSB1 bacterium]|nr:MarR family transcriptional regulator [candidate division KSB1 bacterium]MDZ7273313.1 MarR family transcriptional regulator [candidate division KSB1 bacterium]MDZ7285417.1 MarR family transcriptional regulator [candidate division KSB1 bacterium]MDZ7298448.1 MarR family transcriptional regulator [candidate division KSB1 bacterium]MDZ7348919.1 MarR family transcriptional regulator [candidate division KSB1 bacterium]